MGVFVDILVYFTCADGLRNAFCTKLLSIVQNIRSSRMHRMQKCTVVNSHTHSHFTALWILSGTTRVSRYQKKHSPNHTHRGHQSSLSTVVNWRVQSCPWDSGRRTETSVVSWHHAVDADVSATGRRRHQTLRLATASYTVLHEQMPPRSTTSAMHESAYVSTS